MAITKETAKEHLNDKAVLCCRAEEGIVIGPENLEDPALFDDLVDSGLLTFPEDALTIGQVLGAKLTKTCDSLVPLTPAVLDKVQGGEEKVEQVEEKVEAKPVVAPVAPVASVSSVAPVAPVGAAQVLKLHIDEGRGIDIEIPVAAFAQSVQPATQVVESVVAPEVASKAVSETKEVVAEAPVKKEGEAKLIRELITKHYKIDKVVFGEKTEINGTTLTIRTPEDLCKEAAASEELVESVSLEIITPDKYDTYSETIMDVQPIACKEEGDLGHGISRELKGVVMVLTGTDANGVQIGEFGSSEGELERNIMWGRPGAPDKGEIFIKGQVIIKEGANMERPGPLAAHKAFDYITEEIRKALKAVKDESLVVGDVHIKQYRRPGNKKVLVVKEIMGQGAMHDNLILPVEPVGTLGAKPNVDLGNLPVMLAPTELLDGGVHALTCIGPASKECSRHYYREPLVLEAMADEEIDLVGVLLVGSPQANSEKFYVSKRLGMTIEAMDLDGVIVTTEGFGNNHIDFASHIEEVGKRGVSVVGMTYSAVQGALVVGNEYMNAMVDNNKSKQGIENEILSNNTLCKEDAIRALAMLKTQMGGGTIKKAERKWNPNVKFNNIEVIEKTTGQKVELVDNEQVLPKSKKRQEIYEKEE
ncbi:D-proline reductase (dithiol) proprotein PrdA [Gemelliphila palaticanis]|uniref:D-proline reductase (Dithiol) proprotein PrdA n=1 Tax=Gemelliphila palaticanis TaxID=81950 RepID=A0ABX2T0A1_9BACL|nr:D-proline reductase (dithiol) proprotein PrdA [Gemella palaticanis]MBF0715867.1 D-proline reductase (dithiol) proprotein PrdA [Gemella palaticanis]NYS47797.1 D-proline reductase (dithiol) proprotein PrdA [Gemella palaticanis]